MDTWASTVSSIAGTGVSSTMGQFNLGNVGGFNTGQTGEIGGLNSFVGSLAGSAVTYGMTGNVTFNVARAKGVGLFEMSFGKDGFSSRFGMGGTDISMGTIGSAMKGAQHWGVNNQIEDAAVANNMDVATALRTQYGFGDEAALAQLDGILDGTTNLSYDADSLADAQTKIIGDKRTVFLNNYKDGMTQEEQFKMGIELGHEAYRDGLVGTDEEQFIETVNAVVGHTEMAMRMQSDPAYKEMMDNLIVNDGNLVDDIIALKSGDLQTLLEHVDATYDSSEDYLKLVEDDKGNKYWQDDDRPDFYIGDDENEIMMSQEDMAKLIQNDSSGYAGEPSESNALFGAALFAAFGEDSDALNNFIGETGKIMNIVEVLYADNPPTAEDLLADTANFLTLVDKFSGDALGKLSPIVSYGVFAVDLLQLFETPSFDAFIDAGFSFIGAQGLVGTLAAEGLSILGSYVEEPLTKIVVDTLLPVHQQGQKAKRNFIEWMFEEQSKGFW